MTFSRSGSGRPPPLASRALARSAIDLSGWAARACDCESVRSDIGTLPASIPPTSAFVQSVLPSSARTLACRAAGVIGPIASTRAVPTSGASLVATAAIRPLARSGGVFAVTRAITSRAACGSALRRSMSCRAASMRAASVASSSEADARRSFASPATNASSPLTPQREARPSIWPRDSVESFGSRAFEGRLRVGVERRGLVARPALRQPGDDGVAHPRLEVALERQDRGDRVDRPAPRVVLGDPGGHGHEQPALGAVEPQAGQRLEIVRRAAPRRRWSGRRPSSDPAGCAGRSRPR